MKRIFQALFVVVIPFLALSPVKAAIHDPIKLPIIYEEPKWEKFGNLLTVQEIATRKSQIIYSRNKMIQHLVEYQNGGWLGYSALYITAHDNFISPNANYVSVSQQQNNCTSVDRNFIPYSNNINMDKGDFCEIQDAIVNGNCLLEYPDICPTEDFFLHIESGTKANYRYAKNTGNGYAYKPNPANSEYRKYLQKRVIREISGGVEVDWDGTTRNHPKTGANTIFIDNIELSWEKVLSEGGKPKEFSSSDAYAIAVAGSILSVKTTMNENNYTSTRLWGNLISNLNIGNDWNRYISNNSLDGAMMENFVLNWGQGYYSNSAIQKQMQTLDAWRAANKYFINIAQANLDMGRTEFDKQANFAIGVHLLTTEGSKSSFKVDNYEEEDGNRTTHYNEYYEYSKFFIPLGTANFPRIIISSNPLIYRRHFECGYVDVNFTAHTTTIWQNPLCPWIPTEIM